jgi:putative hemolysin
MTAVFFILGCALLVLLLTLSAFFSSSETVLLSLSPIQVQRIRDRNRHAGARLERLLADPARLLSTVLIGNTLVNVAIASLGYTLVDAVVPAYGEAVAIPLMTLILLVFGEVAPKRLAIASSERFAPIVSRLILFWQDVFTPLGYLLEAVSRRLRRVLQPERRTLNDEELLTMIAVGTEQGELDAEESSMVKGILRLSELKASDVMTPRVDIVGIDLQASAEQHLQTARQSRFRQLPIFNRTPDAIEGFMDVARYLIDPAHDVRKAMIPALFVPENVSLDDLLITFQRGNRHIACVLDEFGGTAGLVTRGDIVELITGTVDPGRSPPRGAIQPTEDGRWLIDGRVSLDEVNRELGLSLDADNADRIAGWVTFHAGRLLRAGETVEAQGCRVQVRRLRTHRIDLVQLERLVEKVTPDWDSGLEFDPEDTGA